MIYRVKKFMFYDGEAFHRGAVWTPKGFPNDREIIRHFVVEEPEVANEAALPTEAVLDLALPVDEVQIVTGVAATATPAPRHQRGRHARNT